MINKKIFGFFLIFIFTFVFTNIVYSGTIDWLKVFPDTGCGQLDISQKSSLTSIQSNVISKPEVNSSNPKFILNKDAANNTYYLKTKESKSICSTQIVSNKFTCFLVDDYARCIILTPGFDCCHYDIYKLTPSEEKNLILQYANATVKKTIRSSYTTPTTVKCDAKEYHFKAPVDTPNWIYKCDTKYDDVIFGCTTNASAKNIANQTGTPGQATPIKIDNIVDSTNKGFFTKKCAKLTSPTIPTTPTATKSKNFWNNFWQIFYDSVFNGKKIPLLTPSCPAGRILVRVNGELVCVDSTTRTQPLIDGVEPANNAPIPLVSTDVIKTLDMGAHIGVDHLRNAIADERKPQVALTSVGGDAIVVPLPAGVDAGGDTEEIDKCSSDFTETWSDEVYQCVKGKNNTLFFCSKSTGDKEERLGQLDADKTKVCFGLKCEAEDNYLADARLCNWKDKFTFSPKPSVPSTSKCEEKDYSYKYTHRNGVITFYSCDTPKKIIACSTTIGKYTPTFINANGGYSIDSGTDEDGIFLELYLDAKNKCNWPDFQFAAESPVTLTGTNASGAQVTVDAAPAAAEAVAALSLAPVSTTDVCKQLGRNGEFTDYYFDKAKACFKCVEWSDSKKDYLVSWIYLDSKYQNELGASLETVTEYDKQPINSFINTNWKTGFTFGSALINPERFSEFNESDACKLFSQCNSKLHRSIDLTSMSYCSNTLTSRQSDIDSVASNIATTKTNSCPIGFNDYSWGIFCFKCLNRYDVDKSWYVNIKANDDDTNPMAVDRILASKLINWDITDVLVSKEFNKFTKTDEQELVKACEAAYPSGFNEEKKSYNIENCTNAGYEDYIFKNICFACTEPIENGKDWKVDRFYLDTGLIGTERNKIKITEQINNSGIRSEFSEFTSNNANKLIQLCNKNHPNKIKPISNNDDVFSIDGSLFTNRHNEQLPDGLTTKLLSVTRTTPSTNIDIYVNDPNNEGTFKVYGKVAEVINPTNTIPTQTYDVSPSENLKEDLFFRLGYGGILGNENILFKCFTEEGYAIVYDKEVSGSNFKKIYQKDVPNIENKELRDQLSTCFDTKVSTLKEPGEIPFYGNSAEKKIHCNIDDYWVDLDDGAYRCSFVGPSIYNFEQCPLNGDKIVLKYLSDGSKTSLVSKCKDYYTNYVNTQEYSNLGKNIYENNGTFYLPDIGYARTYSSEAQIRSDPNLDSDQQGIIFRKFNSQRSFSNNVTIMPSLVVIPETTNVPYVVFIPHSDERNNALLALGTDSAKKIYFNKNYGARNISVTINDKSISLDPNRIFSANGLTAELNEFDLTAVEVVTIKLETNKLVQKIVSELNIQGKIILSLHQNVSLNINNYNGSKLTQEIYINPKNNPHNFVLVNTKQLFDAFKSNEVNVVFQNNNMSYDDGSLSFNSVILGKPYVNIEVLAGANNVQSQIITIFKSIISTNPQIANILPIKSTS